MAEISPNARLERLARELLAHHSQLRVYSPNIDLTFDADNERLVLTGTLPSFYLKQMLQEVLRATMPQIVNEVDVVYANGAAPRDGKDSDTR